MPDEDAVEDPVEVALERIRTDPGFRVALTTARAWGVSPGRFLGTEPARTLTVERDQLGRVVRLVERLEPEWDDAARDAAYALAVYEADTCPGCGHPLAETTDPANEYRYAAGDAIRCHRCTATAAAGKRYEDHPHPSALHIPVTLRPPFPDEQGEVTGDA